VPNSGALTAEQREADEVDLQAGLSGLAAMVGAHRGWASCSPRWRSLPRAIPGAEGAAVTLMSPPNGARRTNA